MVEEAFIIRQVARAFCTLYPEVKSRECLENSHAQFIKENERRP